MTGYINTINTLDINTISTLSANAGCGLQFFSMLFTSLAVVLFMLPIAKYLVWRKDVSDWKMLTLITEMGLEEQDLRNQMAVDFVESCQELGEMDEAHSVATAVIKDLRADLALTQELLEEKHATVYALQVRLNQVSRRPKAKRAVNVMPAYQGRVPCQDSGHYNAVLGNALPDVNEAMADYQAYCQ